MTTERELDQLAAVAIRQYGYERSERLTAIFEAHDRSLSRIHHVARELVGSSETLFCLERDRSGHPAVRCKPLGKLLVEAFNTNFQQVRLDYPLHRFSPVFEVFEMLGRRVPLNLDHYLDVVLPEEQCQRILKFVVKGAELLRRKLGRESLKTAHENFRRAAKDNFNGSINVLEWIAQRHTGAMVLRMDLHFRKLGARVPKLGDVPDVEAIDDFLECRERFHRSFDRRFGKKLLGYAWVLEYGRERGFHAHYLLVLDQSVHDDHAALVNRLGEKWSELTGGRGDFYNCNAHAHKYRYRAVGRIRFDDPGAVKGLHLILSYITLAPLFVKLDVRPAMKTFGKGRFPKGPMNRPGRQSNRVSKVPIRISVAEALAAYVNYL